MNTQTPQSCTECSNSKYCWGYYGGLTCKHREAIITQRNEKKQKQNNN